MKGFLIRKKEKERDKKKKKKKKKKKLFIQFGIFTTPQPHRALSRLPRSTLVKSSHVCDSQNWR